MHEYTKRISETNCPPTARKISREQVASLVDGSPSARSCRGLVRLQLPRQGQTYSPRTQGSPAPFFPRSTPCRQRATACRHQPLVRYRCTECQGVLGPHHLSDPPALRNSSNRTLFQSPMLTTLGGPGNTVAMVIPFSRKSTRPTESKSILKRGELPLSERLHIMRPAVSAGDLSRLSWRAEAGPAGGDECEPRATDAMGNSW